jgi:hypothetical protein
MKFRRADGRDLPFPDRSFDFAHSSAVIEHVGWRARLRAGRNNHLARAEIRYWTYLQPNFNRNRDFPLPHAGKRYGSSAGLGVIKVLQPIGNTAGRLSRLGLKLAQTLARAASPQWVHL